MFKITGVGFHITLSNGWLLSVQWGPYNYCQRGSNYKRYGDDTNTSADAEIAIWNIERTEMIMLSEHDQVLGHVTPDQLVRILSLMDSWYSDFSDKQAESSFQRFWKIEDPEEE